MAYYLIIKNKEALGLLTSHDNEPLKADDDSWYRIKITENDYNMYIQALKDKKEIYIDDNGKIQTRYKLEE